MLTFSPRNVTPIKLEIFSNGIAIMLHYAIYRLLFWHRAFHFPQREEAIRA